MEGWKLATTLMQSCLAKCRLASWVLQMKSLWKPVSRVCLAIC